MIEVLLGRVSLKTALITKFYSLFYQAVTNSPYGSLFCMLSHAVSVQYRFSCQRPKKYSHSPLQKSVRHQVSILPKVSTFFIIIVTACEREDKVSTVGHWSHWQTWPRKVTHG